LTGHAQLAPALGSLPSSRPGAIAAAGHAELRPTEVIVKPRQLSALEDDPAQRPLLAGKAGVAPDCRRVRF